MHTARIAAPKLEQIVNPLALEYVDQVGLETYVREYRNGAKASSSGSTSRIWEECSGTPAWDAGYLDVGTGRPMWHLPTCPNHDSNGCGLA